MHTTFSHLLFQGLFGTAAAGGSLIAHVNLAHMMRADDLAAAMASLAPLFIPLLLLDAFLLAPQWKLPPALLMDPETETATSSSSTGSGSSSSRNAASQTCQHAAVDLDKLDQAGWSAAALQLALAVYKRSFLVAPGTMGRPPLMVRVS